MDLYHWLIIVAAVFSIGASISTVIAHMRVSGIKKSMRATTSGTHSPITVIDSGGGPQYIYPGGGSGGYPPSVSSVNNTH